MKELIEKLNGLKILQTSIEWDECIPEDIWAEFFENGSYITSDLEVDKHRWYETSISVYKLPHGLLGIRSITDLFSESVSVEDVYHHLEFFEMKEVTVISYEKK